MVLPRFLTELKCRKVYRATLVYAGVYWASESLHQCLFHPRCNRGRRDAALPTPGTMDLRRLRHGEHGGLRKRVLESFWLQDTVRAIDSTAYGLNGEPKESVDQDTPGDIAAFRRERVPTFTVRSARTPARGNS